MCLSFRVLQNASAVSRGEESEVERKKMDNNQEKTEYYLDDVVIALDQRHAVMEQEIKNEYQTVREEVKNKV